MLMKEDIVAVIAVLSIGGAAAYTLDTAQSKPLRNTPTVEVLHDNGHGSGVHLGNGYIITAAHIVGLYESFRIKGTSGTSISAEVLWTNKEYDVALLYAPNAAEGFATAALDCQPSRKDAPIHVEGFPLKLGFSITRGWIANPTPREFGTQWKASVNMDVTIAPGNSGGPVYYDADNRVAGIAVGLPTVPMGMSASLTGFSLMVPSSVVCHLMGTK